MASNNIKIAYMHKTQKVWFIRASSGLYAKNFKHGEMIAIKHLEEALGKDLGNTLPTEEEIRSALLKNEKYYEFIEEGEREKKVLNRAGHIILSQIKRFANEIEAGDIIVTKNESNGYNIGVCSNSDAYIDHEPVEVPRENNESPKGPVLRYKLRKEVVWGPSINGQDLPHTVRRSTRGQQTVTNLSDHRVKIFHLIYPFFTDGEHLYFSNKIRKEGDINALVVGKLFENVSFVEGIVEALTTGREINLKEIEDQLNNRIFLDENFVSCQAEFMSPGDMWCKIPLSQARELIPQISAGVLICLLLTGQANAAQLDGLDNISPRAVAQLHVNDNSPSTEIFKEKFKAAKPSTALKGLAEKLKAQEKSIRSIEKKRSTKAVQENLKLDMTSANTQKLEKFSYGINVIELRRLNETD